MRWFRDHKLFTGTFLLVLFLIGVIIFSYLSGGGGRFLFAGIQRGLMGIEKPLSYISEDLGKTAHGLFSFKSIQEENERLKSEVARLSEENTELRLKKGELNDLEELSKAFDFEPYQNKKKSLAASIIALDSSRPYNSFTIDVGQNQGVEKGAIVVDGNGLVGEVYSSTAKTAKVKSILEEGSNISFQVERKNEIIGLVKGDGSKKLSGYLFDASARIIEGDLLVTSDMGKYPEGLPIGKVSKVKYDSDTQLKRIEVRTSARFQVMRKVAVFK